MNYWSVHGILFLLAAVCFPRLTLLFGSATPFGLLGWLGWLFVPSLVVAYLATSLYWDTNPVLCVMAWLWAGSKIFGAGKTAKS